MNAPLAQLLRDAVSREAGAAVAEVLRTCLQPAGDTPLVDVWGVFDGRRATSILSLVGTPEQTGALLVVEHDEVRVLLIRAGRVVGVTSTVLFEQLGRLLYQAERVDHEDANLLVETAERDGDAALMRLLPDAELAWALYRRARDVTAMLFSIRQGHFAWMRGDPRLDGLPPLALDVTSLAQEALQVHQAWRYGPQTGESDSAPEQEVESAPASEPGVSRLEVVDDLFRRIREANIGNR